MEIERKFLVGEIQFDLNKYKKVEIKQSYISVDPVIRLRQWDDQYILTLKSKAKINSDTPYSQEEFELALTNEQFSQLLKKVETKVIIKDRYLIPIENGYVAELDVYFGELSGLKTVEVEFESDRNAKRFNPPPWFGEDVSFDLRYRNNSLSIYGKPQ